MRSEWVLCPVCKNKTRLKLREDTFENRRISMYKKYLLSEIVR